MKKKGFTLIELLAVIVILAVIALIVTPIVTSIISQAKDSANARSVEGHIKGVEYLVLEVSFKSSGNINKYDGTYPNNNVNLLARLANDGMHLQSSDKIDCETYVVSNGLITEATGCKETEWSKTYNYTNTGGAVVSGGGSGSQTSEESWDEYYYYVLEYDDFATTDTKNSEWRVWAQTNTTTGESQVCGVVNNETICIVPTEFDCSEDNTFCTNTKAFYEARSFTCEDLRSDGNQFWCNYDHLLYFQYGNYLTDNGVYVQIEDDTDHPNWIRLYLDGSIEGISN